MWSSDHHFEQFCIVIVIFLPAVVMALVWHQILVWDLISVLNLAVCATDSGLLFATRVVALVLVFFLCNRSKERKNIIHKNLSSLNMSIEEIVAEW